jgi:hypothetical protein
MEMDTRKKFKDEVRSFFGLTILNLVIGALVMALGISLATTRVLDLIETGRLLAIPLVLIGLGIIAIACGFYWIIKIAEIMDGIDDIKTAYDKLSKDGDQDPITCLIIQMMAYYRTNKSTISKMIILGRIGGILFLIAGTIGIISSLAPIASEDVLLENIGQLIGGIIEVGLGITGLVVAHFFVIYSKVWDTRLQETMKIEDALQQKLEAS